MKREEIHRNAYYILAITAFSALPFSKWLSSVSVILLLVNWLLEGKFRSKFRTLTSNVPAVLMIAFFVYSLSGLLFTTNVHTCSFTLQKKLSLLVVGLTLGSVNIYDSKQVRNFFACYVAALLTASIFCFTAVSIGFLHNHQSGVFFYHALGAPLHLHAVYFSVWILIAIGFLFLQILDGGYRTVQVLFLLLLLSWFSAFLLLLSSKLIIVIFALTIPAIALINFRKFLIQRVLLLWSLGIVILCFGVIFSRNPISERFREIYTTETIPLNHANTRPAEDFNGLNLRLLFWKFGYEVMSEKRAWFFGVSGGDSQRLLDDKIKNAGMYTGSGGTTGNGYLGYNFHNQFVESWVQSGAFGAMLLLLLFISLFTKAVGKRNWLFALFTLVFFCFFLSESALERQFGVLPFAILAIIFSDTEPTGKTKHTSTNT